MGPYDLMDNSSALQNSTLVTTAETLVLANAINQISRTSGIVFSGCIYLTPGTGTTSVTVRIRRGFGTTGATDYQITDLAVTAGVLVPVPVSGVMSGAPNYTQPGGGQHSVTLQQVGATANGTITFANMSWWNSQIASMGFE